MNKLGKYIEKKCAATGGAVCLSSADEPGEGEHKIFALAANIEPASGVMLIHGMDADLIMLSLLANRSGIVLMRDGAGPSGPQYLVIDALRAAIIDHVYKEYKWDTAPDSVIIEKYVILCFLLGNDFLPHLPCLSLKNNGYEYLLRIAPKEAMTDINSLILPIFREMSRSEDRDMWRLCEVYMTRGYKGPPEEAIPKDPIALKIINNPQWRGIYYSRLFYDRDSTAIACAAYIKGLYWVHRYYTRCVTNDLDWYYPYAYAPTIRDLSNYLSAMRTADVTAMVKTLSSKKAAFVSAEVQLMTIMPIQSIDILPKKVQKKMKDPRMSYMYPSEFKIHTFLKTYRWECSAILPAPTATV